MEVTSRRERLRAETVREIKAIARRHLAQNGPAAVSLRAIAREMGMTAGALYSYYDTRDDLLTALIGDVYGAVADRLEAARDSRPNVADQIVAVGTAYRDWAVRHPDEFRLIYGEPAAGYQPPPAGPAVDAAARACALIVGLVVQAWPYVPAALTAPARWSDFEPSFAAAIRATFPGITPAMVGVGFRVWGRMHGLVALEVYGHLRGHVAAPERVYQAELRDLLRSLGLSPG